MHGLLQVGVDACGRLSAVGCGQWACFNSGMHGLLQVGGASLLAAIIQPSFPERSFAKNNRPRQKKGTGARMGIMAALFLEPNRPNSPHP